MPFKAKYAGTCAICGNGIEKDDMIEWSREEHEAMHVGCLEVPSGNDPLALSAEGVERLYRLNREVYAKQQTQQ